VPLERAIPYIRCSVENQFKTPMWLLYDWVENVATLTATGPARGHNSTPLDCRHRAHARTDRRKAAVAPLTAARPEHEPHTHTVCCTPDHNAGEEVSYGASFLARAILGLPIKKSASARAKEEEQERKRWSSKRSSRQSLTAHGANMRLRLPVTALRSLGATSVSVVRAGR